MILVIGTPNSGKSQYSEELSLTIFGKEKKAYIATMIPFGKEGLERVDRHQKLRAGKGFVTYEKPTGIMELTAIFDKEQIKNALLECVSNLVGNEIYLEENVQKSDEELVEIIVDEIKILDQYLEHFIVVTNHFEDSAQYDAETKRYIKITSSVNDRLKVLAQKYVIKKENGWTSYENN